MLETSDQTDKMSINASEHFFAWLDSEDISLAFTTYQTNRLFLLGRGQQGRLAIHERLFDKPMGLYARKDALFMSTRYQIWQLSNHLRPSELFQGADRLFVPSMAYTTGDLNIHDVLVDKHQQLLFVNTDFSCLATWLPGFSFKPIWQPPFISKLVAEDRCHLNGLAMRDGEPAFVTACSSSNVSAGWREHKIAGGIVMDVKSNEVITSGLSMPHSPRWYQQRLWLLNSGTGELGYLDDTRFFPIAFCPGFVRGLAFWRHYAVVGLSKLRSQAFSGLPLEAKLTDLGMASQCGIMVIDLLSGQVCQWLYFDGVVEELFDIVVLPKIRQPKALGLQNDDIERLITFPDSDGLIITKPTVQRPGLTTPLTVAGLPNAAGAISFDKLAVKYQQVHHLTPSNLVAYETMSYPSLQHRWSTMPLRGELLAVSASLNGTMIGFSVVERWLEEGHTKTELLSLFVVLEYRHHGIAQTMQNHLRRLLSKR